MKDLKKKIIKYLMEEYGELDATQQVCFSEIEKINVVKITYSNGASEYLCESDHDVAKVNIK